MHAINPLPFRTVLIPNRGAIALRIVRACQLVGLVPVVGYSDADAHSPAVRAAGRGVRLGEAPARASYLDTQAILRAATECGAEAIHPGYGFLSEDAAFAQAVQDAGLVFVGPDPHMIAVMADKTIARSAARSAGVPVLPGSDGPVDPGTAHAVAAAIGYPVMVKAAFGGGGRGMRLVEAPADLEAALGAAAREAEGAFGRGAVFLERAIHKARHIEVQILGDRHGGVVHLGDRDCTMQRRHQKVIEEAPAPALPDETRTQLHDAAVALARQVGYVGAGTIEFLYDPRSGEASFLEMNTRLQVEHGVTELVTGRDLVALQFAIAAGRPLPFSQADVTVHGHAVQARVTAEDPTLGFRPSAGRIDALEWPGGPWIRVDCGVVAGSVVPPHYDSLLGKVMAWGADRDEALARLHAALGETRIDGIAHTVEALRTWVASSALSSAGHDTGWIEREGLAHLSAAAAPAALPPSDPRQGPFRREVLATPQGPVTLDVFVARGSSSSTAGRSRTARAGLASSAVASRSDGPLVPLDAIVVRMAVAVGDPVQADTVIATIEAMKMEMPILAGLAGRVSMVHASAGQTVRSGTLLATIEPVAITG